MPKKQSIQNRYLSITLITFVIITTGLLYGMNSLRTELLRNEAQTVADQILAFRTWVEGYEMIWVEHLDPDRRDFLVKRYDGASGGSYWGKDPDLATRELSTIANASSQRASFKLTNDHYRHWSNRPNRFEQRAIKTFKEDRETNFYEAFEDGHYRFAIPVIAKKDCLKCHGNPIDAPKAVIEKYGDKKAFGYFAGDILGIISVELPTVGTLDVMRTMINPVTVCLIIAAFLINFLFISRTVISRLNLLTRETTSIAEGRLTTKLRYRKPIHSKDEIDLAFHAVNRLRRSLWLTIRHYKARNQEPSPSKKDAEKM